MSPIEPVENTYNIQREESYVPQKMEYERVGEVIAYR